jgi:hypothetical protein
MIRQGWGACSSGVTPSPVLQVFPPSRSGEFRNLDEYSTYIAWNSPHTICEARGEFWCMLPLGYISVCLLGRAAGGCCSTCKSRATVHGWTSRFCRSWNLMCVVSIPHVSHAYKVKTTWNSVNDFRLKMGKVESTRGSSMNVIWYCYYLQMDIQLILAPTLYREEKVELGGVINKHVM